MHTRSLTMFVGLLLVAAALPGAASAATALNVTAEQDDATGEALVVVTENGTAVENATVNVTGERTYAGDGTYRTDANGAVTLPRPERTQNVTVVAADGNATAETTVRLAGEVDLSVAVTQAEDGTVIVGVERNDTAVANASVRVGVENGSYAAVGNYTTDENGTVELAAPAENVTAAVTASEADETATETVTLVATEAPLDLTVSQTTGVEVEVSRGGEAVENATVSVTGGGYAGTGTYETDADGTVSLPAPTENVTVTVAATADGDEASEMVRLTVAFVERQRNFGGAVRAFVEALRAAGFDGPPGRIISDFATANNPGNADDAPGRSAARGPAKNGAAADEVPRADNETRGPPEQARANDAKQNGAKRNGEKENAAKKSGRSAGEGASEGAANDNAKRGDDGPDDADDSSEGDDSDGSDDSDDSGDRGGDADGGERGPPDRSNGRK